MIFKFKTLALSFGVFILVFAGIAKIISGSLDEPILSQHNPLMSMLTFRQVLIFAGVLELIVGGLLLVYKLENLRAFLLLVLAAFFLSYRIGLWVGEFPVPCGCLGTLPDKMGLGIGKQTFLVNAMFAVYGAVSLFYAFAVIGYVKKPSIKLHKMIDE